MRTIFNIYRKQSVRVKAGFWFVIVATLQKAFSLITVPVFTRIMSVNQYGIYSAYLSWLSLMKVFFTLNLESGAYSNVLGKENDINIKNEMTISFCNLCFVIISIGLCIYLLFQNTICQWMNLSSDIVLLMFFGLYSYPIITYWTFQQRFNYKYKVLIIMTVIEMALNVVTGIVLVCHAEETLQANKRILSTVVIDSIIAIILYIYYIGKTRKIFVIKDWLITLRFQVPLLPHFLAMNILFVSDRIMIQKMIGNRESAVYSISSNAAQIMIMIKACIVDAIRPWIYEKLNNKDTKCISSIMLTISIFLICFAGLFSLFAPEIVMILSTKEYYQAVYVIPPVAMSSLFTFLYNVFCVIETYYSKTISIAISSIMAATLNIILNCLLIPRFGFIVAGYTTLISYFLLCLFHYYTICRLQNEGVLYRKTFNILHLFYITVIGFCIIVGVQFIYNYPLLRYAIIISVFVFAFVFRKALYKYVLKSLKKEFRSEWN